MADFKALETAIGELDEELMISIINGLIAENIEGKEILTACQAGMAIVGERFESGEYYVADLIFAGDLMVVAAGLLKSQLSGEESAGAGRMILCTVKGDLHDIGKNIVRSMLQAASFEVIDLGIDVAPETIVKAAIDENINIIAMSGVLTLAVTAMKDTVDAFIAAGLRDKVKILIGGAAINTGSTEYVGADASAYSPYLSVQICQEWTQQ